MVEPDRQAPLAVIGHPVAHSLSPRLHNAALRAIGREAVYEARDIPPDRLAEGVRRLVEEGFAGFNVTIPHKEAVLPLIGRLDASARRVGAVNTVRIDRDGPAPVLVGYNTDVAGFLSPLGPFLGRLSARRALVWGAGGAARAVIAGILEAIDPEIVTVVARRPDAVYRLADDLAGTGADRIVVADWPASAHALDDHDLLVNTTPLGMHPHEDGSPAPGAAGIRPGHVVYDLVYRPRRTRLLREADRSGADTIGGLPMLIGQAAEAFRLWTGVEMPLDAVYRSLDPEMNP